jgi:predicted O-methyltransferase YrrM
MSKIFFFILTIFRILKYLISKKRRYSNLLINILIERPKSILEVGVYNGNRALEMIQAARVFYNEINYYGFDLFEDFKKKILKKEYSKTPISRKKISHKLSSYGTIKLYKGLTSITLRKFSKKKIFVDFIFIDGGHAIKTIENDWKYCSKLIRKHSLVIFDDYYLGNKNIISKFGSNKTYKNINIKSYHKTLLPFVDEFDKKHYLQRIKMFKVKLK